MSWLSSYLEIYKKSHSNFSNEEANESEDEGDEETLAGDEGAAAGEEGECEADQSGGEDEIGEDGELVPRGPKVEVLRHQERDPGSGEDGPEEHDESVDTADGPPQHEVTTPPAHLVSCLSPDLNKSCNFLVLSVTCSPSQPS